MSPCKDSSKEKPSSCTMAIKHCKNTAFPNICELMKILCTVPVILYEYERSTSTRRRLYVFNRTRMQKERLSALASIQVYYEKEVDVNTAVAPELETELCKCRWKNLKDVFVKEKRKLEQQVNGTSVKHKKKWRFYDKLTFLCGYMPVKDIGHNSSITSEDLLKEMQQSKETVVVPHLQEEETESLEISQNRDTFHGIKRKCPCINLKGPDKLHVISQVQDEEGHFGETVAAVLRRLTPYQRAVAKVKIQELLLHAEFNEKAVVPSHS